MELSKIRKNYFTGKVSKMLREMQATGEYKEEDFEPLKDFLGTLKKQDENLTENFLTFMPQVTSLDQSDTVLDELNKESLSEAEISELAREKENREVSVQVAGRMIRSLFIQFHDKNQKSPSDDELMDMAFELLGLEYYLTRDALYKERIFRKQIVEFERAGKQRKLAEEYAKCGIPYREFVLAEGLKNSVLSFFNLAKKRYHNM